MWFWKLLANVTGWFFAIVIGLGLLLGFLQWLEDKIRSRKIKKSE